MYTYIHIPFCKSKCSYCDFFSVPIDTSSSFDMVDLYLESLVVEASYRVNLHNIQSWKSLYVGGGTPGLLTKKQVLYLFSRLLDICPLDKHAEVTFEVNPADISDESSFEYLQLLSDCGVNRISCGIQSLNDDVLSCIQRRSSSEECVKALKVLEAWKKWGIQRDASYQISIDVIAGLPNLCNKDFKNGLDTILQYDINHISLYSLMVEEHTLLFEQIKSGIISHNEDNSDVQWLLGKEILKDNGFIQYEVSNFSKKSQYQSKHNSAYWRMDNYIGLGCSACGTVDNSRYTGTRDIQAYCKFWKNYSLCLNDTVPTTISFIENLTHDEQRFEFLMMGFRTLIGVDSIEYEERFGTSLEDSIGPIFNVWKQKGLARIHKNYYSLTENGLLYLNSFLSEIV